MGQIETSTSTARMLCRRLMEKRLSAVIDLSELKIEPRREYVHLFLDELINLPRRLWHPTFIGLDECHRYAPEKGHGEAESTQSVIDAATLGRKRAYCLLQATQRISKLHKDAAADMQNRFFGSVTLDIDVKRSANDIGMTPKDAQATLRDLEPGEFFAFGPALSAKGVVRFRAARSKTTHPDAGAGRKLKAPKPSSAIKAVMKDFADLPQEAAQEVKDLAAAHAKISQLERDLKRRPIATLAVMPAASPTTSAHDRQTINRLRAALEEAVKTIDQLKATKLTTAVVDEKQIRQTIDSAVRQIVDAANRSAARDKAETGKLIRSAEQTLERARAALGVSASTNGHSAAPAARSTARATSVPRVVIEDDDQDAGDVDDEGSGKVGGMRRALIALAQHPDGIDQKKLAVLARIKRGGSTMRGILATGRREGWIDDIERDDGNLLVITDAGRAKLGKFKPLPTGGPELRAYWLRKLGGDRPDPGAAYKVLKVLIAHYPNAVASNDKLAELAGIAAGGSTMRAVMAKLRKLTLAEKPKLRATDELMS